MNCETVALSPAMMESADGRLFDGEGCVKLGIHGRKVMLGGRDEMLNRKPHGHARLNPSLRPWLAKAGL